MHKIVLNPFQILTKQQQTAAIASKSKLILLWTKFQFFRRICRKVPAEPQHLILLDFWFTRAVRLQTRFYGLNAFPLDPECFRNF